MKTLFTMTHFSFARPRGGARPAASQLGPVTRAIRGLRPNEAPSWEIRQAQINAEERAALRALRKRIKAQMETDYNRIDRCLTLLDAMDGDADFEADEDNEPDAGELGEGTAFGGNLDDEPSLCGIGVNAAFALADSGCNDLEDEHNGREPCEDHEPSLCGITVERPSYGGDDREHDEAERGIADSGGMLEQMARYRHGVSA